MVSLLDIGPLTRKVPIRGQEIEVGGITSLALFELLRDIPELRKVVAQKALTPTDAVAIVSSIPTAVGQVIAAATGHLGDPAHIQAALSLTAGEQQILISAIVEMTFPQSVKSFVDGLIALAPSGALGWDQAMKSPEPSKNASNTDTGLKTAGDTPPVSSEPGSNSSVGMSDPGSSGT